MRKIGTLAIILTIILVACQPAQELEELPTVVEFPTETNTPEATATDSATETPPPTETATNTPLPTNTATETPLPTNTLPPTRTPVPSETINATVAVRGSATALVVEAPVFSTFTPLPPGGVAVVARPTSTGTPEVVADVIIQDYQFQEEVNRLIAEIPGISRAQVTFVPEGVQYELTADNGAAFITATVTVPFTFSGGSINNILTIGGPVQIDTGNDSEDEEIPETFLLNVTEIVVVTQESFNFILNQRLGEGNHDLENIVIADNRMLISLVVPLPSQ